MKWQLNRGVIIDSESFIYTRVYRNNMKRKITELDIDDLREYAESLEQRISRLESVLCKLVEGDVRKMAERLARDMHDENRWRDE